MKLSIHNVGFTADNKLKTFIDDKTTKLSRFYNRIIQCDVYLKLESSGTIKEKSVELKVAVPNKTLISKSSAKTFEIAIDDVTSSMERQLKKYKERLSSQH